MSQRSKLVLAASIVFATTTATLVHLQQRWERQRMYSGVDRDLARLASKRASTECTTGLCNVPFDQLEEKTRNELAAGTYKFPGQQQ